MTTTMERPPGGPPPAEPPARAIGGTSESLRRRSGSGPARGGATSRRAARESMPMRWHLVDVAALAVAVAAAAVPLWPVYGTPQFSVAIALGLVLGTGIAAATAWRRLSIVVTGGAMVLGYFLCAGAVVLPRTTMFGVIPTAATIRGLAAGVVLSWKQVLTVQPPLGTTGGYLIIPILLTMLAGGIAVSIAWRTRVGKRCSWAVVVIVVELTLAMVLATPTAVVPRAVGTVVTVGLVVWLSWRWGLFRPRRFVATIVAAVVMVGAGAAIGPIVAGQNDRLVVRDHVEPPFDPNAYPSPLSAYRTFTKDLKDTSLFVVHGLPKGAVVRLATMDDFDGVVWNVAGGSGTAGSGIFRRVGSQIPTTAPGKRVDVTFDITGLTGLWLPTVGQTTQFTFDGPNSADLDDQLRFNEASGTAVLIDQLAGGLTYHTEAVWSPTPDDATIGSAKVSSVALPRPDDVPEAVQTKAIEFAGAASTPDAVARALQTSLVDKGFFSNGNTLAGDAPSLSGHGAHRIAQLMEQMVGNGEQYASAMALMARDMGLPARVVMGFRPTAEQDGQAAITVTGDQVEAWVEIAFDGYGWVPFFPTPDRSKTPMAENEQTRQSPRQQILQPPLPNPGPTEVQDEDTEKNRTTSEDQKDHAPSPWRTILLIGGLAASPFALIGLVLAVIAGLKARRRRRRMNADTGVGQVCGGWDEILDQAIDLRRPLPTGLTRLEKAGHAGESFGHQIAPTMTLLAERADAAVFGEGQPAPEAVRGFWADVSATIAAMKAGVSRWQRWRTRFTVRSLVRGRSLRR